MEEKSETFLEIFIYIFRCLLALLCFETSKNLQKISKNRPFQLNICLEPFGGKLSM